jgi:hypothetical protein
VVWLQSKSYQSQTSVTNHSKLEQQELKQVALETPVWPAFGFWLFPIQAFSEAGQTDLDVLLGRSPVTGMTHHWPELELSILH